MRDRLAAAGGELAIVTAPGSGTRVVGRIPLAAAPDRPPGFSSAPGRTLLSEGQ